MPIHEAAIEGGKLRFRPIQMTSFAFIAGLIPLVFATGAGAIANRTIGTTGVGGMLVGTVIGVLVIPGLYYVFARIADGRNSSRTRWMNLSVRFSNTKQPSSRFRKRRPVRSRVCWQYLDAHGGRDEVSHIAAETHRDFGRVLIVAKAAELLDFVTTRGARSCSTTRAVASSRRAPRSARPSGVSTSCSCGCSARPRRCSRRADGPIDSDLVRETLILNLPEENYEKGFATFVDWASYGDLFTHDPKTGQISNKPHGP